MSNLSSWVVAFKRKDHKMLILNQANGRLDASNNKIYKTNKLRQKKHRLLRSNHADANVRFS